MEPLNFPPPPRTQLQTSGGGAVWTLVGLLAGGALTPNRDIFDRLSAVEIALLKRGDPAWRLPRGCIDVDRRMAEADAVAVAGRVTCGGGSAHGTVNDDVGQAAEAGSATRSALRDRLRASRAGRRRDELTSESANEAGQ